MNALTPFLRRTSYIGVRRGMSGSRVWMVVGVVAAGLRVLRWVAKNDQDILYRTQIKPGDVFEVITKPRD
jgi:hypothetical protein